MMTSLLSNPSAEKKGLYMLHWWGGAEPAIYEHLGITENYLWFDTPEERKKMKEQMMTYSSLGLVFDEQDGQHTHNRLVCNLLFEYDGKSYAIDYDFGYGYDVESANFMWLEGNYSCDCNRSSFIRDKYPTFPEMDCGDCIVLNVITYAHRP